MSKIIIGIHGLGNKPPKDILEKWWLESMCEGLKQINRTPYEPKFELVYWADIINEKPLNSLITDSANPYFLDEPYVPHFVEIEPKPHNTRKKILGFLEEKMDKILLNEDLSSNFDFISELVFKKYFKELNIYYSKQSENKESYNNTAKNLIRNRLADVLRKHKDKEILLIGHSMGSIIAYDVCNFQIPKISVDTFVTMGSPLGFPIIISKIAEEQKLDNPNVKILQTPNNISRNWYNFSDIEDNVALNYSLSDDYQPNDNGVGVEDLIINNDYVIRGERNPHKSYGYLRAPEFSNILADFLERDLGTLSLWWNKKTDALRRLTKGFLDNFR